MSSDPVFLSDVKVINQQTRCVCFGFVLEFLAKKVSQGHRYISLCVTGTCDHS
jgi:hypothetical protein